MCACVCTPPLSRVGIRVTLWTVAHQTPPQSDFPGKNTGLGCLFLPGHLPPQGSNPHFLHWQADSSPLSHLGSPEGFDAGHFMGLAHREAQ